MNRRVHCSMAAIKRAKAGFLYRHLIIIITPTEMIFLVVWPADFSKATNLTKISTLLTLTFGSGPTEQWRDRRRIGTAPVDRVVRRLGFSSSAVLLVAAAVTSHRRIIIISSSPPLKCTTNTCQVSRNRHPHHLQVPADRRTRRSPLPARPSPRRRRRRRAGRSGSAPWRSIPTTVPITHRRVSRLLAFRFIGWPEREGFFAETRKISL